MSIKLYNSYKLPKMSMNQFFKMVQDLKKEVYKKQLALYKKEVVDTCLEIFDYLSLYPNSKVYLKETYFSEGDKIKAEGLVSHWLELNQKAKKKSDKMDQFYFHINFLFYKGTIYAITREYPNSTYHKVLKKIANAKLYEYWDNTDHPQGMTRSQWVARGKEWERVLGNSSWNPSESSNSVKVEFPFDIGLLRYDKASFPYPNEKTLSDLNRVKNEAEKLAVREKYTKAWELDPTTIWQYMGSDEFVKRRKEIAEDLFKKLKTPSAQELFFNEVEITKNVDKDDKLNPFYLIVDNF